MIMLMHISSVCKSALKLAGRRLSKGFLSCYSEALRAIDALRRDLEILHLPGPRRGLFLKKRKTTGRVGRRKFLQFHEIYLERRHFVRVG